MIRDLDTMVRFHESVVNYIEELRANLKDLAQAAEIIINDLKNDTEAQNHLKIIFNLSEVLVNIIAILTQIADDYAKDIKLIKNRM